MVSKTRRQVLWLAGTALVCLIVIGLTSMGRTATATDDVDDQKLKQKMAQIATEEMVQRVGSMLSVMEYYQPDKAQQRKTLERVANTLVTLSREQMEDVLKRLDNAAAEPDPTKSAEELKEAHLRHIEIMQTLRGLLAEI